MNLQKQNKTAADYIRTFAGVAFVAILFAVYTVYVCYERFSSFGKYLAIYLAVAVALWACGTFLPQKIKHILSLQFLSDFLDKHFSWREQKFQFWVLLILAFAPTYLAMFPGTLSYDSPAQVAQFFGELPLSSANPLVHTYLLGSCVVLGEKLLNNGALGVGLFTFIQGMLATNVLARTLIFFKKRRVPFTVLLVAFLWCVLTPTMHVLTFSCTKDILAAIFLTHFVLNLIEAAEAETENKQGKAPYIYLAVSGILLCLMRNAGIFLVTAVLVVLVISALKKQWKTIAALVCVVLLCTSFSTICSKGLNIPKGEKKENFSLPIQQMAMIYRDKMQGRDLDVTQEQLDALEEILPLEGLANMIDNDSADQAKTDFDEDAFAKDPKRYIKLYRELGKQNPDMYWSTFRFLTIYYWNMNMSGYRPATMVNSLLYLTHIEMPTEGLLEPYYEKLGELMWGEDVYKPYIKQPGIGIWLMVAVLGMAIVRKKKNIFLGALPVVVYFVGILFGPVALLRYLYPVMTATPALLCMIFWDGNTASPEPAYEDESEEDKSEEEDDLVVLSDGEKDTDSGDAEGRN